MLKFQKLPSEIAEEDPVVMSNLLHVFYEDMKAQQKVMDDLEKEFKNKS